LRSRVRPRPFAAAPKSADLPCRAHDGNFKTPFHHGLLGNPFDWLVRQELRFIEMSARSIDLTAERMREHLDPDGRLRDVFMEEFGPIEDFPEELKELIGDYRARFERMNKKPLRGKPRRRSRSR